MVLCHVCQAEARNICSKCHKTSYCSVDCQTKDWKVHKKCCGKPQNPFSLSPFGSTYNVFTGESRPISHGGHFFEDIFGYTRTEPSKVYVELVDVFRLRCHDSADSSQPTTAEFASFMTKALKADILPEWWEADVHGQDIIKFVEEDEWGCLEQVVTSEDIIRHHCDGMTRRRPEIRLWMMAERIMALCRVKLKFPASIMSIMHRITSIKPVLSVVPQIQKL